MGDDYTSKLEERIVELEKRATKLEGKSRWTTLVFPAVAIVVAIWAALNSHQANQFKLERFSVEVPHSGDCEVRYQTYDANMSYLWLCWQLEVTNLSEDSNAIQLIRVFQGEGLEPSETDQIEVISDDTTRVAPAQSSIIEHPLQLDGRKTRRIVVRLPIQASSKVQKVMSTEVMQNMLVQHQLTMNALSNMFPVFDACDSPGDTSNGQFCTKHFRATLTPIQGNTVEAVLPFVQRAP